MEEKPTYDELGIRLKKLEAEILERDRSIEELERIFNLSNDLIGSGNLDGYFTKINYAFEKILGYTEKEFLENPFIFFIHKEDVERTKQTLVSAAAGKGDIFIENRYKCKDGSYKWLEWKVISIFQENKFYTVGREITQRKQAENALHESEERFRTLFTNSEDGMIVADVETRKFIYVNPAICKLLGYTEDELTQMEVIDLHPKESLENTLSEFEAQAKGDKNLAKNILFLKKDRTIIYMDTNASVVKLGGEYRIMGVFRDITDRKLAEEALRESEEKYRKLVESVNDLIFSVDLDGNFLYLNKAFEKIFNYTIDEMKMIKGFDYVHPDDVEFVRDKFAELLAGVRTENVEFRIKIKPDEEKYINVSVNSSPIYDSQNNVIGISCIGRDITELKRVENDLKKSKKLSNIYLNTTTDSAIIVDREGIIISANEQYANRFGKSADDITGDCAWDYFSPDVAAKRKKVAEQVIKSGQSVRLLDEREGRWNDSTIHPLLNENGEVSQFVVFTHDITEFKNAEKLLEKAKNELEIKVQERTIELEEVNTALRVLVKNQDTDVKELEDKIAFNIDELISPNLEHIKKTKLNTSQRTYLEIIENNLSKITANFVNDKLNTHLILTPAEIKITNLIKHGKTNKEIAELHNISVRTVESYRSSIRNKIGIKNKKVNMRSYLISNS